MSTQWRNPAYLLKQLMPTKNSDGDIVASPKMTYHELASKEKSLIIRYLIDTGTMHHREIAQLVGVSQSRITQVSAKVDKDDCYIVKQLNIERIASSHIKEAKRAYIALNKQGKWKEAFEVKRGLIQDLQSMGYITKAPDQLNITLEDKARQWEQFFGSKMNTLDLEMEKKLSANPINN